MPMKPEKLRRNKFKNINQKNVQKKYHSVFKKGGGDKRQNNGLKLVFNVKNKKSLNYYSYISFFNIYKIS